MTDSFTDQDRLVLARTKLWTPDVNKLLRKWRNTVAKRRKAHLESAISSNKKHFLFGLPAAILTTLIATGTLSTFRDCVQLDIGMLPLAAECIPCKDYIVNNIESLTAGTTCEADQWIRLFIGILGVITIVLTSLVTFMKYSEDSSEHKSASDDYDSLFRKVDGILITPSAVRGDPVSILQEIRAEYDKYVRKHPTLPDEVNDELTFGLLSTEEIEESRPSPPKLSFARRDTLFGDRMRKSSAVRNRKASPKKRPKSLPSLNDFEKEAFNQIIESASQDYSDTMDEILAEKNNHDTDDEEEVVIGFDLDEEVRYTPAMAAQTATLLAGRQAAEEQKAMQRALQYELQRLESHTPLKASRDLNRLKSPRGRGWKTPARKISSAKIEVKNAKNIVIENKNTSEKLLRHSHQPPPSSSILLNKSEDKSVEISNDVKSRSSSKTILNESSNGELSDNALELIGEKSESSQNK